MKITVIGGGSTYTPELISGLLGRAEQLGLREVCLMDIDAERLAVVGGFAQRMAAAGGAQFVVSLTTDRAAALDGATFVATQLRVGGMAARREDEALGKRWGLIGQETTGVGGFAKALRTVPVLLEIAHEMRARCPDAWMINFTNPSGLVTEALQRYAPEVRSIGLCNAPINLVMRVARQLGADPAAVRLEYLGLNHLSWLTGATVDGEDVWPAVFGRYLDELRASDDPACPPYLAEALGAEPSYYLHYFYRTGAALAHQQAAAQSRAEQVIEVERALLRQYADPMLTSMPAELMLRGGAFYSTAAAQLIDALHNDTGSVQVVNTRNGGAAPGWPADWVAELPCRIDAAGAHPLPAAPLPPLAESLVRAVKAYELLTAEAAMRGDRALALQALVANPLGPDADQAPALFDELLRVNRGLLPRFGV